MTLRFQTRMPIRRRLLALCWLGLLLPGARRALAQDTTMVPVTNPGADSNRVPPAQGAAADTGAVAKIPADQLDALVAPIALYPDELLAQTLVASTYPLEIIQLHQWMAKYPNLKDKALADSVAKQPWDPSVQSMAAVPEVVKRLADDIQWATDLGNAFLAQQGDVMDAVQRMRAKAKANGALESNEQQKVDTQVVENKTVIVVESTNPEVVYVPTYAPAYVYGPPVYPYPPIYYPPYYPGTAFVSFSVGFMMGAAMWGGSCCHAGWGGNNIYINNSNNFNQINHNGGRGNGRDQVNGGGRGNGAGGNNNWQHNPSHRGGAPYGDKGTAGKYGGSARGPSAGTQPANRGGGAGGPSATNRAGGGAGGGTGRDQVGSRDMSKSSGSRNNGGFSGGSGGYSGSSARSSSSRGASSMGSRGGGSRGGGGGRRR
jgi:uncharacterized protein DUF3300